MNSKIYCLILAISIALCFNSYAMGGPVPEDQQQQTSDQTTTQPKGQTSITVSDRVTELDKARADMKMEKAELQKLEKYLWQLDIKMADARKKGDTTRLLQLKEQEQDVIEKARLIQGSIARRLEKYPELKVSEAMEKGSSAKPAESSAAAPVALPVPNGTQQTMERPKPVTSTIIHTVQPGDTLYSISRKYFNTPTLYKEIARMNNLLPTEGLYVGEKLKIDLNLKGVIMKKPVVRTQPNVMEVAPTPVEELPKPVEDQNL